MAFISYQTNKNTGQKYAYRCENVKNPDTNKTTLKRTYLGKVDPISGEIIPKGTNGRRNTVRTSLDTMAMFQEQKDARQRDSEAIAELASKVDQLMRKQTAICRLLVDVASKSRELSDALEKITDME